MSDTLRFLKKMVNECGFSTKNSHTADWVHMHQGRDYPVEMVPYLDFDGIAQGKYYE